MHSGFSELRNKYNTDFVGKYTGAVPVTAQARKEIERALRIWGDAREATAQRLGEQDQGFLFGSFGIADSFYWPVLWRIRTYNLPLETATPETLKWIQKMWADPVLKRLGKDYFKQAEDPETVIPKYDDVYKGNPDITYGRFEEDWDFQIPDLKAN
jgi:glutathione S-transferase